MNHIQRYLSDEVVEDYADGLIDRREALRRLGLLGVAAATSTGLLAACATPPPANRPAELPTTPAGPAAQATEAITFPGEGRTLQGAYAGTASPRGAVLVIHENRGLTDHIRSVAGRLAASGFSALAVDLLSEEGGTRSFPDEGAVTGALGQVPPQRFVADMRSGVTELMRRNQGAKVGAIGFCFGGGMVWSLLAAGEPRLAAAAPFYGPLPAGASFAGSPQAAVLGVYAGLDTRITSSRDAAESALKAAGLTYEIVVYPGVDHAFFNDTGGRFDPAAAGQAYAKVTAWFTEHLAP